VHLLLRAVWWHRPLLPHQVDAQLSEELLRQEVAEQLAAAAAASKLQLAELTGQLDSQGQQLQAQLQEAQQALAAEQDALAAKVRCGDT
jgi:hypothetical protein